MSVPVSVTPILSQGVGPEVARHTATFHPNFWGDRFLHYNPDEAFCGTHGCKEQQILELKQEVGKSMEATAGESSQLLKLIDSIQRLGVAYHFEREIEEALKAMYQTYGTLLLDIHYDLTTVSLLFRLLRQEGYRIPSDVFKKFMDEEGNFKESLISDLPGLLALYEAAHLMVHGEDILHEALAFTTAHLRSMLSDDSDNPLKEQIIRALKRPIRKGIPRVEARHYISIYQQDDSHDESLLKLAKLDYNMLQSLHKKELSELTKWWKGLDFATKLPFARDRIVEGYFWMLGVYFEPQYDLARKILMKVFGMLSVVDDMYDAYGTFEELKLFTEAVERWDAGSIDQLPDYMKLCYQALLDVYGEMEEEMSKQGKLYRAHYAKAAFKKQVQAYLLEARWLNEKCIPTMEEYMKNALISSGSAMLTATSFVGMGDIVTKEVFDWVFSDPKIIKASMVIGRLMNDIVSHELEQERGHAASAVECYIRQYGVSKEEAYDEFKKQIENAWKDLNEEFLQPTAVPVPVLARALNFSQVMDVLYKDEDEYTLVGPLMKDLVAGMLIDPVPI